MLKLIIEDDEGRKTVVPFVRDEITIGRQEGNTIRLTERNVSRRHARLSRLNGHVSIEDLGSYNGIRINGDRIAGRVQVTDGDLIQIGDYDLAVQAEEQLLSPATVPLDPQLLPLLGVPRSDDTSDSSATVRALPLVADTPQAPLDPVRDTPAAPLLDPADRATAVVRAEAGGADSSSDGPSLDLEPAEAPRLVVLNSDLAGKEYRCLKTELTIGRDEENDVPIDHRSLSRTHCRLVRDSTGEWRIMDLESANGMVVNGESYSQVTLRPHDIVELGHIKLEFLGPNDLPSAARATAAAPATTSRAPVFAVVGAVAVIIIGLGGYALWKSISSPPPNSREPLAAEPRLPQAEKSPTPPTPPSIEDERAAMEAKLQEAERAVDELQWERATELLKGCTVAGRLAPQAERLLNQMAGERGNLLALQEAERLLDASDEVGAKKQLDLAAQTVLLSDRLETLKTRHAAHVATKMKKVLPIPLRPTVAPPQSRLEEAERLHREAQELSRAKEYTAAAAKLEKCQRIAPSYSDCFKLAGSVYAKISTRDKSQAAYDKARAAYKRYLSLAPASDPDVLKVESILKAADDQMQETQPQQQQQ